MMQIGGAPHRAGDDAGLCTVMMPMGSVWMVQPHIYAVEPLADEAATALEAQSELEAERDALRAEVERLSNVDHNADLWCEEAAALKPDAERYLKLRNGDNDDDVLRSFIDGDGEAHRYLPRGKQLDTILDELKARDPGGDDHEG